MPFLTRAASEARSVPITGSTAEGAWIVEQALPDDVFADDPDHLWDRVLRRKGRAFDLMRSMPIDPTQN